MKLYVIRARWEPCLGLILLATLLLLTSSRGEIIPASRRINWDPGIPGGIPARTTIHTTLSAIDKTGTTDVTSAIQTALNQCAANQVVMLPAGTFRINGTLSMPSNVTLRGAGPTTVLKSYGSVAGLFQFGTSGVPWNPSTQTTTISSGATAGATSMVVASNSGISVGTYLVITETNDPAFVSIDGSLNSAATWVDGWNTSGNRARGQIVEVTSVSGTTVGFTPALYSSFTRTPWATRFTAQCKNSGVEDLKTSSNNTGAQRNFLFQCAAYCWVKNVECDYTDGDHVTLDWSYRCEVRHSYFHDAYVHTSGSFDNMIGLRYKSTACLIIDNIIRRLHVSVMCEWGAAGNVIAYNYDEGNFDQASASGNRWLPVSMNSNHGAHPQFNLFEGNISQKFQADAYWGSSSDTTVFRNYFSGTGVGHPPYTGRGAEVTGTTDVLIQGNRAIDIWELQSRHNVVGNVVGSPALNSRGVVRKVVSPAGRAYDNPPYLYSYGYTSESDGGSASMTSPTTTLLEHGNYDVKTNGIVWDAGISDQSIPASLFLAGKPAWFGNLAFPPITPTRGTVSPTDIPAGYRYVNGVDPGGGGGANQVPVAAASATPTSGMVPLVVAFSSAGSSDPEGATLTYNWNFGDGTTSTAANPSKTYSIGGSYTARVAVSDGINSTTSSNIAITAMTTNQPPTVVATGSPTSGVAPLTVAFSSAGTVDPEGATLTYNWNFGDGTTSTAANPSKTYASGGTYTARVTVSDGTNSTTSANITITASTPNQPPTVVASGSPLSGVAPLAVAFTSAGTVDPEGATLTYNWNFGDGTTSTAANPSKTYSTGGTYTARVTVSDGTRSTTSANITITASTPNQPPTVVASGSPLSGVAPLTVAFSSAGTVDPEGAALTYNWIFGDGTTSTAANPSKTYATGGAYTARVTVSDGTKSTTSGNITITASTTNQPPTVVAGGSPTTGVAPLTVAFSSAGTVDPEGTTLTYNWTFGDGTTSTSANPTKTYSTSGTYTARLTVSDGTSSVNSSNITVSAAVPGSGLVAAFAFDDGRGNSAVNTAENGNVGAVSGAKWVKGKYGKALSFNGTSDVVSVANSPSLTFTSGLTIEAWVYPTSTTATWRPVVFKPFDATQISYVLQGRTPQNVAAFFVSPSSTNLNSPAALPVNTWSHLATTYDGANMRIFVNGTQVSSKAQTGAFTTSSQPLTIGGNSLYSAYWQGQIDEVRIYNRALSPAEIQADMSKAILPEAPSGLRIR